MWEFIGFEGALGGEFRQWETRGANPLLAMETGAIQWRKCMRTAWCSGEMQRYHAEPGLRRRNAGFLLTLKHESVGIEQD